MVFVDGMTKRWNTAAHHHILPIHLGHTQRNVQQQRAPQAMNAVGVPTHIGKWDEWFSMRAPWRAL